MDCANLPLILPAVCFKPSGAYYVMTDISRFGFADDDPAAVVDVVNRQLYACSETGRYATLFLGVFDQTTGVLHYVNAGHNPPLLVRRDGAITLLDDAGFPVGMFPDSTYAEVMVQLRPGDLGELRDQGACLVDV